MAARGEHDGDDLSQQIAQLSQEVKQASTEVLTSTTPPDTVYAENPWWSVKNAMTISVAVLAFGLMVIFTIAYLIQRGRDPEQLLKIFGTTLILVMAVFLVVAGYSDQQISPVIGLMGTIAGYLLGRSTGARAGEQAAGPSTGKGEKPQA